MALNRGIPPHLASKAAGAVGSRPQQPPITTTAAMPQHQMTTATHGATAQHPSQPLPPAATSLVQPQARTAPVPAQQQQQQQPQQQPGPPLPPQVLATRELRRTFAEILGEIARLSKQARSSGNPQETSKDKPLLQQRLFQLQNAVEQLIAFYDAAIQNYSLEILTTENFGAQFEHFHALERIRTELENATKEAFRD